MSDKDNKKILLCIENKLYEQYLNDKLKENNFDYINVDFDKLAPTVAENQRGTLVLQSDSNEYELIEICKRLKRIFIDEIKILFLSADYKISELAYNITDEFFHFPMKPEELIDSIKNISNRTKKILIIDDSKLVHKHLTEPLKNEGYEVLAAFNGKEGYEKAVETIPDLVICDIEMPIMNGFEASAAIKNHPKTSNVYIIMSSTLGSAADQRRGFQSGVDEYITKPVIIPELLNRLNKIFRSTLKGRENILIIEPDNSIAKNVSTSLSKQGFSPRVTQSIKEAVKILKRFSYELLITEIELSDGSAIDLLNALKTVPKTKLPSILVFTSKDNQAEMKMVMNAGADEIISKPFTADTLLANVERSLANRRAKIEKAQIEKYVSNTSKKMAIEKSILSGSVSSERAYKKNATVYFSDIKSFTPRCEKYEPKAVVRQINTLFSVMTKVIIDNGGDVDKFMGDACMAFWLDEDPVKSSELALITTIKMREELKRMNEEDVELKNDPIFIRFGINTGEVILCDIGSAEARIDLTIIGDSVNLAARLESAAKQYGIDNLISEFTIRPLLDKFHARIIDVVKVKGKNKPVECYELLGLKGKQTQQSDNLVNLFSSAFEDYKNGDFIKAKQGFEESLKFENNQQSLNPSKVFIDRCNFLIENKPEAWNGVWELTSK